MPIPQFKYEKLSRFIFGALLWLAAAYALSQVTIAFIDFLCDTS